MKEAQIVATIHRIGEDIIALADYLAVYVKEEQTNAEDTVTPVAEKVPAAPAIKLEDVRTVLAEISRSGKTAQMKELLGRFGASKLSDVKPEDYVIATGKQHSVREFATLAFHYAGIELNWQGEGMDEKGIDLATGKVLVEVSPAFYRPTDVVNLLGDPSKARMELGWNPTKTSFEELVRLMMEHDMKKVAAERG